MTKPNLEEMSLEELKDLQKTVSRAIRGFETRRRSQALAAAQDAAKTHGFSLAELLGQSKKPRSKQPPKYGHPENPELTWSGMGRRPQWFKEAIEAGVSEESLEIR